MNKKVLIIFVISVFLFCSKDHTGPQTSEEGLPRSLNKSEKLLITSYNNFGLKLFREVVSSEEEKNIVISPLSASFALGMTYNGADEETEQAMRSTLEYGSMTNDKINESYKSMINLLLNLDPKVQMEIANSIWYENSQIDIKEEFENKVKQYFDAQISGLDFSNPGYADIINGWVSEKTNGKIEEIIDENPPIGVLVYLINAIYFKGTWKYQFDPENTYEDDFNLPDGSKTRCMLMSMESELRYGENEQFQAVELPYGDGKFCMDIILPKDAIEIDELIAEINPNVWTNQLSTQEIKLYFPRFKVKYKRDLKPDLISLGMGIAFSRGDHFPKIDEGLFIDKVKHKTFIEVNEEGTEAAAVTSVEMIRGIDDMPVMRVDRPFIFAIREIYSGTVIFVGKVVEVEK